MDSVEESIKAPGKSHEKERKDKGKARSSGCEKDHASVGCSAASDIFDLAFDFAGGMAVYGGEYSFYRVGLPIELGSQAPVVMDNIKRREFGEPTIPFARFDYSYRRIDSRIDADDFHVEFGYGAIAVGYDKSHYKEHNPDDTLKISSLYGLYRMSFGSKVELDFGMGSLNVKGNRDRSYFYSTTPIQIVSSEYFGFEFRPSWAANLAIYDINMFMKTRYAAVRLGYKSLNTGSQSLEGPYIGVSAYY